MQSPVPALSHSLTALSRILTKAQDFETAKKLKPEVIPNLRLIADMLPFWRQITICCDHAKGATARLSGTQNPVFDDTETTLAELQARIEKTLAFMASVPTEAFAGAETREITIKTRGADLILTGEKYYSGYALPNFYFHMSTAYNILRGNGLEIGKVDFLGG